MEAFRLNSSQSCGFKYLWSDDRLECLWSVDRLEHVHIVSAPFWGAGTMSWSRLHHSTHSGPEDNVNLLTWQMQQTLFATTRPRPKTKSVFNPMGRICMTLISTLFWVITQRIVVIPYRRFGTILVPSSRCKGQVSFKMGQTGCPETWVKDLPVYAVSAQISSTLWRKPQTMQGLRSPLQQPKCVIDK
jgi:hypothetical protein